MVWVYTKFDERNRHIGGTDTCAMQTTGYTITSRDTEIIRDLVAFLGEDVFDQRQRDGTVAKSDAFQRRISEARSVLKGLGAYDMARLEENRHG